MPPGIPSHWQYLVGTIFGVGAGMVTGAVFLASVTLWGAIQLAIVGGFLALASPVAAMGAYDEPKKAVYLKPGATLMVKLK